MRRPCLLLSAFVGISIAACAAPSSDASPDSRSDEQNEGRSFEVAPAPEWARCWVEGAATAGKHVVKCALADVAKDSLAVSRVGYEIMQGDRQLCSDSTSRSVTMVAKARGCAIADTAFPVDVIVHVTPDYESKPILAASEDNGSLSMTLALPTIDAATTEHPVLIVQPFQTWAVTFVEHRRTDDDVFTYTPAPFSLPSAPFTAEDEAHASELRTISNIEQVPVPDRRGVAQATFIARPPADGPIRVAVALNLGARVPGESEATFDATIDGPGIYVVEPTGVRKGTPADLPAQ